MPVKPLDEVAVGDVLARDLKNAQGMVLAKQGARVTDALLRTLKMWGVESVKVNDGDAAQASDAGIEKKDLEDLMHATEAAYKTVSRIAR